MKKTIIILIFSLLYGLTGIAQNKTDSLHKITIGLVAGTTLSYLIGNDNIKTANYYAENSIGGGGTLGIFTELFSSEKFAGRIQLDYNLLVNKIRYRKYFFGQMQSGGDTADYNLYYSFARVSFAPVFFFNNSRLYFSFGVNMGLSLKGLSFTKGYIKSHETGYMWDSTYYPGYNYVIRDNDIINSIKFYNTGGLLIRFGGKVFKNNEHIRVDLTAYNLIKNFIEFPAYKNICGSISLTYLIKNKRKK